MKAGVALSESRSKLARSLSDSVCRNLSDLSLPSGGFKISVERGDKLLSTGLDRVEFTVNMNGSGRFEPLRKVASGGESSRIMLALKCALADSNPSDLMVFDEIDTGISGSVAFQAGRKLSSLAEHVQVLCITHLPQVACFSDSAFLVSKRDGLTKAEAIERKDLASGIQVLMAGSSATTSTLKAAKDLVSQAEKARR